MPLWLRPRLMSRLRLMTAARVENASLLRSTPRCRQRRWPFATSQAMVRSTIDHRPVLAVIADQVAVGSPAGPVRCEVLVVVRDKERFAVDGRGATSADGAAATFRSERRRPAGGDVGGDAVGTGHGSCGVVDVEVVAVELVIAEVRVPSERPGFDQDVVLGIGEFGEGVAGPVRGVGQHVEPGRFVGEQGHAGRAVAFVRRCQIARGDQSGVGFDRDVGFVAVAI